MKKHLIKLMFLFVFTTFAMPSYGAISNGIWINDARSLFLKNKAIILAINIRSFNAQDKDKNDIIEIEKGDIAGNFVNAIDRLDEIQKQGVNTIHLLPITPTGKIKALGTAGSLYAISDFTKINPQLDDKTNKLTVEEEAINFIKECHKRNIRVIVDLPSCGAYDLYISNPNLFQKDSAGQPIVPADWTDVRLFKTLNEDGSLNDEVYLLYKKYIDLVQKIGADGIRADVATSKPFEFWQKLITYAQKNDREFLFLAEASESWNEPIAKEAPFTPYYKLLEAGFDGWYGSFFDFKDWNNVSKLEKEISIIKNIKKEFAQNQKPKAVIGSFVTHDEQSAIITGGMPFAEMIIWLQATLPVNSYFVDGFQTGDSYQYKYENQKATKTYTDDDFYYVHKGKFDIFNFSRKPGGINKKIEESFKMGNLLKTMSTEILNNGTFEVLNTGNNSIFSYMFTYKYSQILVVLNKDLIYPNNAKFQIKNYDNKSLIMPLKISENIFIDKKSCLNANLLPGEIAVFLISKQDKDTIEKNKKIKANYTPVYR